MLDPVDAYDRIAASFARLSEERRAYLEALERLVTRGGQFRRMASRRSDVGHASACPGE
jgi:hypothetical protein